MFILKSKQTRNIKSDEKLYSKKYKLSVFKFYTTLRDTTCIGQVLQNKIW